MFDCDKVFGEFVDNIPFHFSKADVCGHYFCNYGNLHFDLKHWDESKAAWIFSHLLFQCDNYLATFQDLVEQYNAKRQHIRDINCKSKSNDIDDEYFNIKKDNKRRQAWYFMLMDNPYIYDITTNNDNTNNNNQSGNGNVANNNNDESI